VGGEGHGREVEGDWDRRMKGVEGRRKWWERGGGTGVGEKRWREHWRRTRRHGWQRSGRWKKMDIGGIAGKGKMG